MSGADDAVEALWLGQYQRADEILVALGATKRYVAPRLHVLWALTQILRRNLDEAVDVLLEVAGRAARGEAIYHYLEGIVGPLETVFPANAAQEIRLRMGDYFLRQEQAEEALHWLHDARSASPHDPLAIYLDANCRFALYGERAAVEEMEAVLERATADRGRAYFIGGGTAALWYRLGVVHDRLRNLEKAARYLARSVELTAENTPQRLLLGDVLIRLGRFDEAIVQLAAVPRNAENYRTAARLRAVALFRLGDTETALLLLQEVAEIDPLGALTFLEMGWIHLALNDTLEAEIALARAFRTDPDLAGLKSAIIALERVLGRTMDADAGLPPAGEFDVPEEFVLRLDDAALNQRASVRAGAASYFRVLRTLMLRDILNQQRETGIGYLGTIVEPLVMIGVLDLVYHFENHQVTHGVSIEATLFVGIGTYYFFLSHIIGAVSISVKGSISLFYFREVTPLVVIAAAALRQFLTGVVAFSLVVGGFSIYQNSLQIVDPLMLLAALSGIAALSTIAGVFFGLGELVVPSLRFVEVGFRRLMLFCAGIFFYANDLPPQIRGWIMLNPVTHYFEFVKGSMFATYQPRYAEWSYPLPFIFVGFFLIVVFERATRRYLVAA